MTTESDVTAYGWTRVTQTPPLAGMAISLTDPGLGLDLPEHLEAEVDGDEVQREVELTLSTPARTRTPSPRSRVTPTDRVTPGGTEFAAAGGSDRWRRCLST